ncbi:MAG: 50S ribosomal protein L6 [Clostridia bacterium]|nr:50S ribosomal protein L6 [Clostridia bacterium]
MSRIGRKPITVPAGVEVTIDGSAVTVKGPKGTLSGTFNSNMTIAMDAGVITVTRPNDEKENRSLHGLTRTLIANMVEGVSNGYSKTLDIVGIGYRANMQGKDVVLSVGYSHTVTIEAPEGITITCPSPNQIIVSGADKQVVGQVAAEIRGVRPPEPYKGKGIRYSDEHVRRKEGKAGKGGK